MSSPSEERRPRIRAAVAVVHEGRLLLVQHTKKDKSYWLLPGGGLEWGESLREAACREVQEETGLSVTAGDVLFVSETLAPDDSKHVVHLVFSGRLTGGNIVLPDEKRITAVDWFPLPEVPSLTLHPPIQAALAKINSVPSLKESVFLGNLWVD